MFEKISSPTTSKSIQVNWQLPNDQGEKLYSADYVIEAYLSGKKHGEEQTRNLMVKQFTDNLDKSIQHTDTVLKLLSSKNLSVTSVHLRPNSFDNLEVLITVPEKDFLSDVFFDEIYDQVAAIEYQVSDEFYNISFNFINRSEQFDPELLLSDGFLFHHKDYK